MNMQLKVEKLSQIKDFDVVVVLFVFLFVRYSSLFHGAFCETLRPCHTLPDSANGHVTDSKILSPFVSVRMRFLSVPHAVNAFHVK